MTDVSTNLSLSIEASLLSFLDKCWRLPNMWRRATKPALNSSFCADSIDADTKTRQKGVFPRCPLYEVLISTFTQRLHPSPIWAGTGYRSAVVSGPWPTCYLVNINRRSAAIATTTFVGDSMGSVRFVRMRARETLPSILDTKHFKAAIESRHGAFDEWPPSILVRADEKWVQTLNRGNCLFRGVFEAAQMLRTVAVFLFWK